LKENKFRVGNLKIEPINVIVRNLVNISLSFNITFDLPKDSFLIFRLRGGRNNKNDWYYLQPFDPNLNGYIELNLSPPVKLNPMLITGKDLLIKHLVCDEKGIKKDTIFQLNIYNTLVQSLVENKKKIEIMVELPNKKPILIENSPTINVINEQDFDHITLICPSTVAVNEEFKVLIRVEDRFKNLVKDFSERIQIYEVIPPNNRRHLLDINFNENNNGLLVKNGI